MGDVLLIFHASYSEVYFFRILAQDGDQWRTFDDNEPPGPVKR
jgi:hypothetical protein